MSAEITIRAAESEDIEAAHAVLADCHRPLYGEPMLSLGMFTNLFTIGTGSVAESAAEIVGAAVVNRDVGRIWVLHAERRRGIGTRLLERIEDEAADGVLRLSPLTLETAAAPFLVRHGYRKGGEVWLMAIDLASEPAKPAWPDGFSVRTFDPVDAPAVKQLLDEAYSHGEPRYVPLPFEDWHTFMLGDPSYDPGVWFLALEGDEIVGAALNWQEGYVKDLVVSPRLRGRGLGKALMLETFAAFRGRGVARVELKTDSDNPTEAWRLYERLGMKTELTYEVFEKTL